MPEKPQKAQYNDLPPDAVVEHDPQAQAPQTYDDLPPDAVVEGQEQPSATRRFASSFAKNLLPSTTLSDYWKGPMFAVSHPIESAKLLGGGMYDAHRAMFQEAGEDVKNGRYVEAAGHGLAGSIPLIGPAAGAAGDQIAKGDIAGGLGGGSGLIAGVFAPKAISKLAKPLKIAIGENMPTRMVDKLIKPTQKNLGSLGEDGWSKDPAGEIVRQGIVGTRKSFPGKVIQRQAQVGNDLAGVYANADQRVGPTLNGRSTIRQPMIAAAAEAAAKKDPAAASAIRAERQRLTGTFDSSGNYTGPDPSQVDMTPTDLWGQQKEIGRGAQWTPQSAGFHDKLNGAMRDAYTNIGDTLDTVAPEAQPLRSQYANLLEARKAIAKRWPVQARNSEFSLGDQALASAGIISHAEPSTAALLAAKKFFGGTFGKTAGAQVLRRTGNLIGHVGEVEGASKGYGVGAGIGADTDIAGQQEMQNAVVPQTADEYLKKIGVVQ